MLYSVLPNYTEYWYFELSGSSSEYAMELHHKEQIHENVPVMQAEQYPVGSHLWILNSCFSELHMAVYIETDA
jgi:hypothetical protein